MTSRKSMRLAVLVNEHDVVVEFSTEVLCKLLEYYLKFKTPREAIEEIERDLKRKVLQT